MIIFVCFIFLAFWPFPWQRQPFCTLVTMATAAILNFFSTLQKMPHTTVDIPTKFHEVWWKESKKAVKIQKSSDLGEIWFPSRVWCCELISMVWGPYCNPLCRNIHRSMWQLLGGWKKFKMAAVAMVTKVQNGCQIQKSSDLGEIWFPSRIWCCELIFIVGLLWRPFWIQNGR